MMRYPFLPLGTLNRRFEPALTEAVGRVVASGRYIGGPEVAGFESRLAAMCGTGHAVGVSTGLDALRLILRAMVTLGRLNPGDGVIVPSNSYIASALAIVDAGLRPVMAEPSEADYLLHADEIDRRAGEGVRAVMPVDLYGRIAATEEMMALCRDRGLLVIEDAAQAIGATRSISDGRGGRIVAPGQWADAAAFSFYPAKNVGALGDGGAVVTDDAELAATVRALANYGETERYHCTVAGFNCRLDPIQAAVLSVKLPHTDDENAARRRNAAVYCRGLASDRIVLPPAPEAGDAVHQYVVRCVGVDRQMLRSRLKGEGIETAVHYPVSIDMQPAMAPYIVGQPPMRVARRLAAEVLSLPVSSALSADDIAEIARIINHLLEDI